MTEGPPPAGWYQEHSLAGHRRWWDGQAWTEYIEPYEVTAPSSMVVPQRVIASPYGAQATTAAAHRRQDFHGALGLPVDEPWRDASIRGTFQQAPKAWYRKKRYGLAVVLVVIAVIVVANGAKSTGNQSAALSASIMTTAPTQLEQTLAVVDPGSATKISVLDASCVQTAGTQQYSCTAHFSASDAATGETVKLVAQIVGTCDAQATCQWHATGPGQQVG